MFELPPIPSWDGLHVLIVHFPIALLAIVPVFLILGLILKRKSKCMFDAALLLMVFGTIGSYIAVSTGESAEELVQKNEKISQKLEEHSEHGETVRNVFTALTVVFAAWMFLPRFLKKELNPKISNFSLYAFVLLYLVSCLILANTAHEGGELVHTLGVKALMY